MTWIKWNSLEAFNAWHDQIKKELGLPKNSIDASGQIKPDAVISTNYVTPIFLAEDDIRALIDDKYIEKSNLENQKSENPFKNTYDSQP